MQERKDALILPSGPGVFKNSSCEAATSQNSTVPLSVCRCPIASQSSRMRIPGRPEGMAATMNFSSTERIAETISTSESTAPEQKLLRPLMRYPPFFEVRLVRLSSGLSAFPQNHLLRTVSEKSSSVCARDPYSDTEASMRC